jgi:hypothetical protein
MKPLLCILLVITLLITVFAFSVSTVDAYQYKSGTIISDTTWTKADGPYRLTGTVYVNSGVTLTIESGTIIDLYTSTLYVYGTLICRGLSTDKITFYSSFGASSYVYMISATNWNESNNSGSIIDNTVFSSTCAYVSSCSPKISNNLFIASASIALRLYSSSSNVTGNAFDCPSTAIYTTGSTSPIISNNFIKSSGNYGVYGTAPALISNNNITGCSIGILSTGNCTITGNLITSNNNGVANSGTGTIIQNNTIAKNGIGINGIGLISNNTIGQNNIGLTVNINATSSIVYNNIYSNTTNLQFTVNATTLNVSNNWWGTTDSDSINQTIQRDYPSSTVIFTPYLTSENPYAPAIETINYTPAPTPTPFITPNPVPSPPATPTPTPWYTITPTAAPSTVNPTQTIVQPTWTPTPTPTPTPIPTPSPTPKVVPGSPLAVSSDSLYEYFCQLDVMGIASIVLIGLGLIWVAIVLAVVSQKVIKKVIAKT